mmetsp:Transcript_53472/g.127912  ORF Transcript_53472/g.127912 Transcript_53472/m.127912 type:complete len:223 (-) Transcript_53472:509-1177(-)
MRVTPLRTLIRNLAMFLCNRILVAAEPCCKTGCAARKILHALLADQAPLPFALLFGTAADGNGKPRVGHFGGSRGEHILLVVLAFLAWPTLPESTWESRTAHGGFHDARRQQNHIFGVAEKRLRQFYLQHLTTCKDLNVISSCYDVTNESDGYAVQGISAGSTTGRLKRPKTGVCRKHLPLEFVIRLQARTDISQRHWEYPNDRGRIIFCHDFLEDDSNPQP